MAILVEVAGNSGFRSRLECHGEAFLLDFSLKKGESIISTPHDASYCDLNLNFDLNQLISRAHAAGAWKDSQTHQKIETPKIEHLCVGHAAS